MSSDRPSRPEAFAEFEREIPSWFADAKLGIFVHWGPYSVPAWAEPIGPLGTFDGPYWFAHNPYAEWYQNTIRIPGSPAAEHHRAVWGAIPYSDFLDLWSYPADFDAPALLALVKRTGARYFVPTTKHHDGVTLWPAPGSEGRNTVGRGPHADLISPLADAAREAGVRFGVYYSGGLDWGFTELPPITDYGFVGPQGEDYAAYAYDQVSDLIDLYKPDVLWCDVDWPSAGKEPGPYSLERLFRHYYEVVPEGVVNDRWGDTHWDYRTTEYESGQAVAGQAWENCRGVGLSFGVNDVEDESHLLSGADCVAHFVDVVSRGGNFLLNIGLTASGAVPAPQRRVLEHLAEWNETNGHAIFESRPLDPSLARPSSDEGISTWWTRTREHVNLFVSRGGPTRIDDVSPRVREDTAQSADGTHLDVRREGTSLFVDVPQPSLAGPVLVQFAPA